MIKHRLLYLLTFSAVIIGSSAIADTVNEANTARYFDSIQSDSKQLKHFLWAMPKGADLHVHVTGATFAENMLNYAYPDNLCVNPMTFAVYQHADCDENNRLNDRVQQPDFKKQLIDAWSMRHFNENQGESSHDHFFNAFKKFSVIPKTHPSEVLAEIAERAASQNENYLELMVSYGGNEARELGTSVVFDTHFNAMREQLLSSKLNLVLSGIRKQLDTDEAFMRELLRCGKEHASLGCNIKIRYLLRAEREQAPELVFAQLLVGFEAAKQDPRIVGVNMVQAEDGPISMRDYKLQMQMVGFLQGLYPDVPVSLHAGELTEALVPKEGLSFHIHDAVEVAHASRIGHGVDIAHEDNFHALLDNMAKRHVMVEINLTSNDQILGVKDQEHPLPLYLEHGVPVSLSTDDEGVSRINLTKEYLRAVLSYKLDYLTLKKLARNSLNFSFLPGKTLWQDNDYQHPVSECANDLIENAAVSSGCKHYLAMNEKASLQWDLEVKFTQFEERILHQIQTLTDRL